MRLNLRPAVGYPISRKLLISRVLNRFLGTPNNDRVSETRIQPHQLKRILRMGLVRPSAVKSRSETEQQANVFWDLLAGDYRTLQVRLKTPSVGIRYGAFALKISSEIDPASWIAVGVSALGAQKGWGQRLTKLSKISNFAALP